MKRYLFVAMLTAISVPAVANIEWPLLYAFRGMEFTTALVLRCNKESPSQSSARLRALGAWKVKNESLAKAAREFSIARARSEDANFDLAGFDRELNELEVSALRQVDDTMCTEMAGWLWSEDSYLLRQLPHFMQPKPTSTRQSR